MNLPSAFLTRMQEMLGEEYEAFLQSYESGHYQSLRLNPRKTDREEFMEKSPFHLTPVAWEKNGFYYSEEDTQGKHPYHEAGVYYIQEASAMAPVGYLDVQPGDYVLDLCAAPGGKTILLAEQMQGTGTLYSCDAAENRVGLIRTAVDRMGFTGVHTLCNDATKPNPALPMADRILTDVPCSGLGILAKKPDMRYKKREADRQAELLMQSRYVMDDDRNTQSMRRQQIFLNAFMKKIKKQNAGDVNATVKLYDRLRPYATTDIKMNDLTALLKNMQGYTDKGIITIDGTSKIGEKLHDGKKHWEFYMDEDSLETSMKQLYPLVQEKGK